MSVIVSTENIVVRPISAAFVSVEYHMTRASSTLNVRKIRLILNEEMSLGRPYLETEIHRKLRQTGADLYRSPPFYGNRSDFSNFFINLGKGTLGVKIQNISGKCAHLFILDQSAPVQGEMNLVHHL